MSDNLWQLAHVSSPSLTWGSTKSRGLHQCPYCHLELLTGERPGFCCGPKGKYTTKVAPLPPLPPEYDALITHHSISRESRLLNLIFSFASVETTHAFPNLGFPSFLAIQGKVYHRIRPSHRNTGLRWLLYDGFMQENVPFPERAQSLPSTWILNVKRALLRINPFVAQLRHLSAVDLEECPDARLELQDTGADTEIAAIINYENTSAQAVQPRNLVCVRLDGVHQRIPLLSRNWEPLTYPLLFPHATLGWGLPSADDNDTRAEGDITQMWYYRYRLLHEPRFRIFGRLTNEYLVDMFSRNLESRLSYIRLNQERIKQEDAELMGEGVIPDNDNVYLPSSFLGSNRWASEQISDALAIAAQLGNPTFFITMTCNPEWPEITSQCRPGQDATDIPLVVARVFHQKMQRLIKALKDLFPNIGPPVYIMHSIEFQKRGFPHGHILVKYPMSLTPEQIDSIISAEMPTDETDAALVQKFMVHRHSPSYCMKNRETCRFHFPHDIRSHTEIGSDGRVLYRRRTAADVSIVAHVLKLLRIFRCHINFECASTSHIFQYLFKYIYKGPDYTRYAVTDRTKKVDEIEEYWKARYLTGAEAAWRILGFHIAQKDPSVTALPIHLPTSTSHHIQYSRKRVTGSFSLLTRYFLRPQGLFVDQRGQLLDFDTLHYIDYFQHFRLATFNPEKADHPHYYREQPNTINAPRQHVILRTKKECHVARLQAVMPSKGELFYLRALLRCCPGRSFEDFYFLHGIRYPTYQEAATARGLFAHECEVEYALREAVTALKTPRQLRYLFIHLLTNDCIRNPIEIWSTFAQQFSEDFVLQRDGNALLGVNDALNEMTHTLEEYGHTLGDFGLPQPEAHGSELAHEQARWDPLLLQLTRSVQQHVPSLTQEQRQVYDHVIHSLDIGTQFLGYVDGKAGRGKTWVIKCICESLRSRRCIVLPTATSAFAAQQYEGGRTTHSTFKVPVNDNNEFLTSPISSSDNRADLLRATTLFVWDEVPMANRAVLACVDETLQKVMGNDLPFGGKSLLLAGDFRQTCPVIRGGNRVRVVDASVRSSPLWPLFNIMRL